MERRYRCQLHIWVTLEVRHRMAAADECFKWSVLQAQYPTGRDGLEVSLQAVLKSELDLRLTAASHIRQPLANKESANLSINTKMHSRLPGGGSAQAVWLSACATEGASNQELAQCIRQ